MQRVVDGAVPRVDAEHAPGELRQVGLSDDDRAGVERSLDDGRVGLGHVVAVDARAVGRADPGCVDQVLDEQRAPGERPLGGAEQGLVEPGDRRVVGVGWLHVDGTHRHALDLDLRAGDHEPEISTSVEAGRVSPNTSCRTGLMSGRSFDVGEVDGHLDDVGERAAAGGEHGAHVLEHAPRLGDDVVTADELALLVHGDDAADEEEAARLDGVREMRDRLGLAGDAVLATGVTRISAEVRLERVEAALKTTSFAKNPVQVRLLVAVAVEGRPLLYEAAAAVREGCDPQRGADSC